MLPLRIGDPQYAQYGRIPASSADRCVRLDASPNGIRKELVPARGTDSIQGKQAPVCRVTPNAHGNSSGAGFTLAVRLPRRGVEFIRFALDASHLQVTASQPTRPIRHNVRESRTRKNDRLRRASADSATKLASQAASSTMWRWMQSPRSEYRALRRYSGKQSNIDDSVRWRFWVHSAVDAQRMDGDSSVAGVQGVSARTGRRGEDSETVGAAQACSQGV